MSRGILVGVDATQEWLLPWWWKCYSHHSALPVTFVDFGMTPKSLAWCQERGETIPLNLDKGFIAEKKDVEPELVRIWEQWYGVDMWQWRAACFNKPFALVLTPYLETLWLDLDCEILQPVEPIFEYLQNRDFAVASPNRADEYNSGVMVYKKNVPILQKWIDLCVEQNALFCGDDYALTYLINHEKIPFQLLPKDWNWITILGINFFVKIFHWMGVAGKNYIKHHNGIQDFLKKSDRKSEF